jgi:trans-L-3-hydroxyproline dehydratase
MCGHGIVGLTTVGIDCGLLDVGGDPPVVRIDTPAGRVTATAHRDAGRVVKVSFHNVPSFLLERNLTVDVSGLGSVRCDIAFGGAFYAYVDADDVGVAIDAGEYTHIIDVAMRIKRAVMASFRLVHPDGSADLNFLYGTIIVQRLEGDVHSRNVCVFADGEVDRSPTGTGVSGRAAIHHARDELALGETITIESIIGTKFEVRVVDTTVVGSLPAVIPEVTGSAHITGRHEFLIDPNDPLRQGLLLR